MAGEAGFKYEQTLYTKMKKAGLVPAHFRPAGSDSNLPDGMFLANKREWKLEIKLDPKADFGQGSLEYDLKAGKWILGGGKTDSAQEMQRLLTSIGTLKFVNKEWGKYGPPMKATVPLDKFKKSHVDHDYKYFTDRFLPLPADAVANYYNTKQTYYIQIGNFGFYVLGRDMAGIKAPKFNPQLRLRIRLKRGGSYPIHNYRFSTAIQVQSPGSKSPLDLDKDLSFLLAKK